MEAHPVVRPDLYELYKLGETLIIEYLGFSKHSKGWLRDEKYVVVGYAPEFWSIRCTGPDDVSPLKGPPSAEDAAQCRLCNKCRTHTQALHAVALRRTLSL
jgi:hypothetical protein